MKPIVRLWAWILRMVDRVILPRLPFWRSAAPSQPPPPPPVAPPPVEPPGPAVVAPTITSNRGLPISMAVYEGAIDVYQLNATGTAPITWSAASSPPGIVECTPSGLVRFIEPAVATGSPVVATVFAQNDGGSVYTVITITVVEAGSVDPRPLRLTLGHITGEPVVGRTLTYNNDIWLDADTVDRRWTMDGLPLGSTDYPLLLIGLQAHSVIGVRSVATNEHGTTIETIEMSEVVGQDTGTLPLVQEGYAGMLATRQLSPGDTPQPITGGAFYSMTERVERRPGGGLQVAGAAYLDYGFVSFVVPRNEGHSVLFSSLANSLRAEVGVCIGDGWIGQGGNAHGYVVRLDRNWQASNPLRVIIDRHDGGNSTALFTSDPLSMAVTSAEVVVQINPVTIVITVTLNVGEPIVYTIADSQWRGSRMQIGDVVAGTGGERNVMTFKVGIGEAPPVIPFEDRYRLIYAEEFDGTREDVLARWKPALEWGDTINDETQVYGADLFEVADSVLSIVALRMSEPGQPEAWISDALTTFGRFAAQYGLIEIRCRLTAGNGGWPAFWLMGREDTWPGGEIDVVEMDGGRLSRLSHALHHANPATGKSVDTGAYPAIPYGGQIDDWVTISAEWLPSGRVIFRARNSTTATMEHSMHRPSYMLVNLAIAPEFPPDFWISNPDGSTPDELRFEIDHIRWWQRPSQVAGLPVITVEPEISRAGDVITISHGVSNAETVRGVLRTGVEGGAMEIPGTERVRTGGGAVDPTTFALSAAVPEGKVNWYEEHRIGDHIVQTASYPWHWFRHDSLAPPPPPDYRLAVGEQMQIPGTQGAAIAGLSGATWGHTVRHRYSKQGPWNCDGTRMVLMNWGGNPGNIFVHGRTFAPLALPNFAMDEPLWHVTDPALLYYVAGNQVRLRNVVAGTETTVYTWAGRTTVAFGNGEGNFSDDGRYVVLTAGASGWPPEPVQAMGVLDTQAGTLSIIDHGGWYIDNATISPTGAYIVVNGGANSSEANGVRVYTRAGALVGSLPHLTASHYDVTIYGGVEYLVGTALQAPHYPKVCAWRLSDLSVTPWAAGGYGWHTSARNTQARHLGVLASMYPSPTSSTQGNQAILVRPDGVTVAVPDLAFPGSNYTDYWAQPHGVISPDGTHVLWARRINGTQISAWVRRIA